MGSDLLHRRVYASLAGHEAGRAAIDRWLAQSVCWALRLELGRLLAALSLNDEPIGWRAVARWRKADLPELWRAVRHLHQLSVEIALEAA